MRNAFAMIVSVEGTAPLEGSDAPLVTYTLSTRWRWPSGVVTLAHTLKGSARGIGAWRIARAAEAVEAAGPGQMQAALDALAVATEEARATIAELLKAY